MKILSINVSLPKKIKYRNKTLYTSIYKVPVKKKLKINKLGLEGDKQADLSAHGGKEKAVYGYSYEHYKYWGNLLNLDFTNDFGLIGENLTIDKFNEKEIFIGDEFELQNTILKVSQPRIPCYKLSLKMGHKEFLKHFIEYNYLGAYFKVIKNGDIEEGSMLKLIKREKNSLSLYDVSKLLFKEERNIDMMRKALEMAYLSDEIKTRFCSRLAKLGYYEYI